MPEILFDSNSEDAGSPAGLVSVAISLYNYERHIEGCMESVSMQTYRPIELLVVDDGSADASGPRAVAVANRIVDRFHRIRVARHTINKGLAEARNTGFRMASGALVFVLDADNEIYPRCIERLVEAIEHSKCDCAYSQLEFFGDEEGIGLADEWSRERFLNGNYVDAMALVRKAAWAKVKGYSKMPVTGWEDYDFWCKFVEAGLSGIYVPEMLCRYQVHKASMLRTQTNPRITELHADMKRRHRWLKLA